MSSKKCLYKANSEITDDSLTSACFQINPHVELKDTPTNGEEYLLKVVQERQKYSFVSKCDKDYSELAKNQSRFVKEILPAKAPPNLKPTIEWQNIQVADFSDTRSYISRMIRDKQPHVICKIEKVDIKLWRTLIETQEPTLSSLINLHNAVIHQLLELLIELLGCIKPGSTISRRTGQWMYALLACLRQPLLSDTLSLIRDIARQCAEIRSHLEPDNEESKTAVAPLNIFICLIARYFRQYDLADGNELSN